MDEGQKTEVYLNVYRKIGKERIFVYKNEKIAWQNKKGTHKNKDFHIKELGLHVTLPREWTKWEYRHCSAGVWSLP